MAGLPQRVGSYEIVDRIGAGGMGEVYRARDTRLGRDVAIKILSRDLVSDSQHVARLEREAHLLAALNHPAIATIHGVETFEGTPALILELVEGPTLAERLARQRLPEPETLSVALQIAEALETAHDRGIVHRDLKPANIKFTTQGRVKVLDFGIAKMVPTARDDAARSAGQTMMATEAGAALVIGTPAYMSPEQARGEAAERTSDTWAFGCVVFEMLTGTRAFQGGTTSDVISAVLRAEPDWQALPADTSLPLTLLLRRCLQKDPRRRLQHIGDARIEIEQLLTDPVATAARHESPRRANRAAKITVAALLGLVATTSAVIVRSYFATPPPGRAVQFQIPIQGAGGTIKISPDGRHIAYVDPPGSARNAIWIRPLDSLTARTLPGTEGAGAFTWSWDSRFIAFTARPDEAFKTPRLKKIDVATGSTQVLADDPSLQQAPAWGQDDVIVFASPVNRKGTIRKVSANGGDAVEVTVRDLSLGERSHMWPSFLPDGRHFLYLAWSSGTGETQERGRVYVGSIDPAEPRRHVMDGASMAIYARPGYLLFATGEALMARPFDATTFQFTGDSVTVSDAVQLTATGRIGADVSDDGTLIYRRQEPQPSLFAWRDRSGTIVEATKCPVSTRGPAGSWRLAPNGNSVAVFSSGDPDIWLCDLTRNQTLRLSNDPFADLWPVWSPDSSRIVFQSVRTPANRDSGLYEKAANGATPERVLVAAETGLHMFPHDWSLDGNWIVFGRSTPTASDTATSPNRDLWLLPMTGSPQPRAYLQTPFDEIQAALSPDARYLAYVSNEVGLQYEVVVQSFPDPSRGKWTVSTGGGCCPQWKRDGGELYYTNRDRQVVAVPVRTTPTFEMGQPTITGIVYPGFQTGGAPGHSRNVTADGQRFLVNNPAPVTRQDETTASAITVLLNWVAGSKLQR